MDVCRARRRGAHRIPTAGVQAKAIAAAANLAPFGRGAATLVDTSVRNTWQLEPAAFSLTNPKWQATVESAVEAARQGLGVAGPVTAHLYKLLLYEPGGFFVPHRCGFSISAVMPQHAPSTQYPVLMYPAF